MVHAFAVLIAIVLLCPEVIPKAAAVRIVPVDTGYTQATKVRGDPVNGGLAER
jgi:hypothetical protein